MKLELCIVGSNYKRKTVISLIRLIEYAYLKNWIIKLNFCECADVFKGRDWCLDGDCFDPPDKKPFKGEDYDYILWCDTDQVFDPQMVQDLIDADKDVISACIKDGHGTYCQGKFPDTLEKLYKGETWRLSDEGLAQLREPFEVDFTGFGFLLVKKGVYEQLDFSWHRQLPYGYPNVGGMLGEDGSFCKRIREKGIKIWVHPRVKVNHIKEHEL